jgi:choline dehydrogenase
MSFVAKHRPQAILLTDWQALVFDNQQARWALKRLDFDSWAEVLVSRALYILSLGHVVITDRLHAHLLCLTLRIPHVLLNDGTGKNWHFHENWTKGTPLCRLARDPAEAWTLARNAAIRLKELSPSEADNWSWQSIADPARFPEYHWPDLLARRTPVQEPSPYLRGRGLGGSSAVNWLIAHRAPLEDFDGWAAQGCAGWSGEDLLPSMNRLERDLDFGDAPYHCNSGAVTIRRLPIPRFGKVDLALLQAGLDLGYPWRPDLNAPGSTGISPVPVNRFPTSRGSTNDAYLEPARARPNLTIHGETLVDRVLFDGRRAVSVRARGSSGWSEYAGREIILSAGSTFTPPILVRSGVGPSAEVRAIGIAPVRDLPVGRNLRDHAVIGLRLLLRPEARAAGWDEQLVGCAIRYSSRLAGAGDNDMIVLAGNLEGYDDAGRAGGFISVVAWQTFSEGVLRVVDRDPFAMPEIDEHLLSDERDLVRMRDGVRRLFTIARHPAMQAITAGIELGEIPGVAGRPAMDDLANGHGLDAWILATVSDTWHITGTCRMGAPDDPRTVVDPDCRVLGVENLRVIDGSIMPDVPRANTNLPIMTIAEHMAARLRGRQ